MTIYAIRLTTPADGKHPSLSTNTNMKWFAGVGGGMHDLPYMIDGDAVKDYLKCLKLAGEDAEYDKTIGLNVQQWANGSFEIQLVSFSIEEFHTIGRIRVRDARTAAWR